MPKWRITVLEGAKRDFARAIERSATDFGARQARTNLVTLDRAIAALCDGPDLPGSMDQGHMRKGLRSLHVARRGRRGRHVLFFRVIRPLEIEVVRILHDAMDFGAHLKAND